MYIDSLIVRYKKKNFMLQDIALEVGLYDAQEFIDGCNYTSSQFI
jgi:hypothetical protein